ncbi:MAG: LLM class F420-dependent oxidoreductase [Actinomycetota bacterium]
MTDTIRIAVQLQPQHADYDAIRNAAVRAEEAGVDIIYNWDHFYPLYGGDPDPNVGKHFECWTMLASWAEVTERVELGALVTCNSYRNPELLADMARTVDHISNGRLILGIGAGWFEKDYTEYGYEFGTFGTRLAALEDSLPRIDKRLAAMDPAPMRDIPILVGGGGEKKTLRYTARHADIWHSFGDLETFTRKTAILDEWCATEGTDSSAIERSVGVDGGDIEAAEALAAAGARQFTVGVSGPDYDLGPVQELVAWRDGR